MVWIIVGYMWLFMHRPFEVWPILGTLRLERLYMIFALIAWASISQKEVTENRINLAIAFFVFAMLLSSLLSPYVDFMDNLDFQNWIKYIVFYVLLITSIKSERDFKILITAFLVCFALYMLHSYREFLCGKGAYRMGIWRMTGVDSTMKDPNTFGASITIILPMTLPALALARKKWHYLALLAYLLLSIRCVQLTGSRTAFVGIGFALGTAALFSKHRWKLIPIGVIGAVVIWFSLTEELQNRYMTLINPEVGPANAQGSAEGRWHGFVMGWDNWSKSPIWGVGPGAHGLATGDGFKSHCLYGEVPGELGSVGILAFLMLLSCYALNHLKVYSDYQYLKEYGRAREGMYFYRVSIALVFGIYLTLFFGLGGHNAYRYTWIWYAAFQAIAVSLIDQKVRALRRDLAVDQLAQRIALPNAALPPTPLRGQAVS